MLPQPFPSIANLHDTTAAARERWEELQADAASGEYNLLQELPPLGEAQRAQALGAQEVLLEVQSYIETHIGRHENGADDQRLATLKAVWFRLDMFVHALRRLRDAIDHPVEDADEQ